MTPFITPDRWRLVEPIFDRALDLPIGERAAYLDDACSTDRALRDVVEALLLADADSSDFLETSAESMLRGGEIGLPVESELEPGTRVGVYRIARTLGHGGMGTVYLGERADGHFEQTVALKLIRRGRDSAAVHRRFLSERQILARLQHPNIARLVDGGLTAGGQPWLAMEYIDGSPLLDWCDQRRLPIDARLTLFEQVAEAVRYAHQNLVVHRDLKPSNILVTADGQVKLLDFGIAKLLNPAVTEASGQPDTAATETGLLLLTPEYAAPEQIRGEPVTTATDVYALGAVLYELISGQRVHRFERRSAAEMERIICEQDPEAPSAVVTRDASVVAARSTNARRLFHDVHGDLDTIVLTALQKAPSRRYPTVDALLVDLRNQRGGLPIRARPASLRYRLVKFARRHRVGVAAATMLVFALGAGVVATLWQAKKTAREAARAQAVKEFLIGLFRTADPSEARGREITARELLTRGAARVDSALAAEPSIREELLGDVGRIHRELGLYQSADTLARRAAELAKATHGESSIEYSARLTEWGATSRLAGHAARSDTVLRRALELRQRLLGARHPDVASTLTELARTAGDRGEIARANDLARKAMEIDRAVFGPEDLRVARDFELLAGLHAEMEGEHEMADTAFRASLAAYRRHYDADHPDVVRVLNGMAANLRNMRRYVQAESIHRDVLARYRRLHPTGHPNTALALHDLGVVLGRQHRYAEAESAYIESLAMRRRLLGEDLGTVEILNDLGVLRIERGDLAGGEAALREGVEKARVTIGPAHPNTVSVMGNLAVALTRQKKYDDAERVLREVVEARRASPNERPGLARALTSLGVVLRDSKRYAESEKALREAETIAREKPDARKSLLAAALSALGVSFVRQDRVSDAEPLLREAVSLRQSYLDSAATARLADERSYGDLLVRLKRYELAESVLIPAFHASTGSEANRAVNGEIARALVTLYEQWGRRAEAERYRYATAARGRGQ